MALRPLQPLSLRRKNIAPILPFQPGQDQILAEQQQLEAEGSDNLFFQALQIPNRLLFGQSIQGGLEGIARDGIGEGVRKAFINNPVFQAVEGVSNVTESLFGLDIAEGAGDFFEFLGLKEKGSVGLVEDTSFVEIRQALGWKELDNKILNFGRDLLGELVTSPLELIWTPFGLTKAGRAAKAADVSADLGRATEAGMKALVNFKVPLTQTGFHVPMTKSLDLYTARVLQSTADFLRTNKFSAPILGAFDAGSDIRHGDASVRAAGRAAIRSRREFYLKYQADFLPALAKIIEDTPDVILNNKDLQLLLSSLVEVGVEGADEMADVLRKLQGGRQLDKPRFARRGIIDDLNGATDGKAFVIDDGAELVIPGTGEKLSPTLIEGGDGTLRKYVSFNDHPFVQIDDALRDPDKAGLADAVRNWQQAFPEAQLPDNVLKLGKDFLEDRGVVLRSNVDFADSRTLKSFSSDPALRDATGGTEEGFRIRGNNADEATGTIEEAVNVTREQTLPDILAKIEKLDNADDVFQGLKDAAVALQDLSDGIADKDLLEGLINGSVERYYPRDLSPKARELVEAAWSKVGTGRKFRDLTIAEINSYVLQNGIKLTKHRSVKDLMAKEGPDAFMKLMKNIFPDSFITKLKSLGDDSADDLAQFLNTNVERDWYKRIEKSANETGKRAFYGHILASDSPIVLRNTTIEGLRKDIEGTITQIQKGNKFLAINSKGNEKLIQFDVIENADTIADIFNVTEKAKRRLATNYIDEVIAGQISQSNESYRVVSQSLR